MLKIKLYFQDVINELTQKVSWPTWAELQSSAVIVMVASLLIAVTVYIMDVSFKSLMEIVYNLL